LYAFFGSCFQGTFGTVQGTFGTIQGTVGTIQGTFGTIQGTFGTIQVEGGRKGSGQVITQAQHQVDLVHLQWTLLA
jgi:hypothetical protein